MMAKVAKTKDKGQFALIKLKVNTPEIFSFDQSTEWMESILTELNAPLEEGDVLFTEEAPQIHFKGEITKKQNVKYGDIVVVKGDFSAKFITTDIQTGTPMMDRIDVEVRACYIDEVIKKKYELEDEVTIIVDDEEYDLFLYQSGKFDLYEVLREYAFINKNPYPVLGK
ncbi:MAG: hypothetical protein A2X86_06925 [Bdellovibrionales bacterium GWA2_49_15]|nr:MAG: hypothetical protein A2X86_06925 [Bdellovibrionales bacterium GWA2_49_15]HAZ11992.1 hypothetical protein [Bdellovibrionales bacterium]